MPKANETKTNETATPDLSTPSGIMEAFSQGLIDAAETSDMLMSLARAEAEAERIRGSVSQTTDSATLQRNFRAVRDALIIGDPDGKGTMSSREKKLVGALKGLLQTRDGMMSKLAQYREMHAVLTQRGIPVDGLSEEKLQARERSVRGIDLHGAHSLSDAVSVTLSGRWLQA